MSSSGTSFNVVAPRSAILSTTPFIEKNVIADPVRQFVTNDKRNEGSGITDEIKRDTLLVPKRYQTLKEIQLQQEEEDKKIEEILAIYRENGLNYLNKIDKNFKKNNADTEDIIYTYNDLQVKFENIKKEAKLTKSNEDSVKSKIIIPYCDYMIASIEQKKQALQEE